MTYNPSIPQANDDPTISQAQLLANFGIWNSSFSANHIPLTSGANQGFHTSIFFPTPLGSDPNLSAPISSLYPKSNGTTNELFFQNGATSANVKQLTNLPIVTGTAGATGFGFVTPWGWIVNCGTVPPGTSASILFQVPYAVGFITLTAQLTQQTLTGNNLTTILGVSQTNLTYTTPSNSYFLVIGK